MRSNSKHISGRSDRMWKRRSPGVDGADWTAPSIGVNGLSSCGHFSKWRGSQRSRPIPTMHDSRPERSRKPTSLTKSSRPTSTEQTLARVARSLATVTTRKTAARDRGRRRSARRSVLCPNSSLASELLHLLKGLQMPCRCAAAQGPCHQMHLHDRLVRGCCAHHEPPSPISIRIRRPAAVRLSHHAIRHHA
jgi:hypothetical protein